jgi:hypothetical protein
MAIKASAIPEARALGFIFRKVREDVPARCPPNWGNIPPAWRVVARMRSVNMICFCFIVFRQFMI